MQDAGEECTQRKEHNAAEYFVIILCAFAHGSLGVSIFAKKGQRKEHLLKNLRRLWLFVPSAHLPRQPSLVYALLGPLSKFVMFIHTVQSWKYLLIQGPPNLAQLTWVGEDGRVLGRVPNDADLLASHRQHSRWRQQRRHFRFRRRVDVGADEREGDVAHEGNKARDGVVELVVPQRLRNATGRENVRIFCIHLWIGS